MKRTFAIILICCICFLICSCSNKRNTTDETVTYATGSVTVPAYEAFSDTETAPS